MTDTQRGANGRIVRPAANGWGTAGARYPAAEAPGPTAQAAIGYAERLGWPLTPGFAVDGELCDCGEPGCAEYGAHPVPGAWRLAACATPTLVRVVWRMCTDAPVLLGAAALGG